jgi:ABC-type phosphate transport system permease subunit
MTTAYQLKKLKPETRQAREAAIARVAKRTKIPAMYLMCGKRKGVVRVSIRMPIQGRLTGYVLAYAASEEGIE